MRAVDFLLLAYRAIRANPLRSVLTTLGVIIGVASVVALVSLGQGAGRQIAAQIKGLGSNLIIVTSQVPPNGGTGNPSNIGGPPQLFPDDADVLRDGLPDALAVVPEQSAQIPVRLGARRVSARVIGTWSAYPAVRGLRMAQGQFLSPAADQGEVNEVVLGADVAYRLFGRLNPLGRPVYLRDYRFKVVGVAAPQGFQGFQNVDQFVYVPFLSTQKTILVSDVVNTIYVQAASEGAIPRLERAISDLLAEEHGISDPEEYDFSIRNQAALLATAHSTLNVVTTLLTGIAAISLLVGGIGIMNIMLVSVTERTREIGIRVALGAVPREIVAQFITEAVLLSALGGGLGVLAGVGVARVISATAGWSTVVSPVVVLVALGFSFAVGVFFGWYPAYKASRLDPIQALRYE